VVEEVAFEILHPDGPGEKPVSRSQRRVAVVERLRNAVAARKSWSAVEKLLAELEEVLWPGGWLNPIWKVPRG
jgi:hypothetical protein